MSSGQETTRLPVRSALFKQDTGGLVVRWVTTSESPLLYVFVFLLSSKFILGVLLFGRNGLVFLGSCSKMNVLRYYCAFLGSVFSKRAGDVWQRWL